MRFMILVKATSLSEAGTPPSPTWTSALAAYHGELVRAGVLLDAATLQPSARGWRLRHGGAGAPLAEGPFAPPQTLVAGYTLIQVRSREEAMEWARRHPAPDGDGQPGEIEVRQLHERDDAVPGAGEPPRAPTGPGQP